MKKIVLLISLAFSVNAFGQNSMTGIPDSAQNIHYPGSTGQYSIVNPLDYNGTMFTNSPTTANCTNNCKSDYLYLYDLGLTIPSNAIIKGIQVIQTHGGCNSGSYMIDTLQLAYNGSIISKPERDSAAGGTSYDTLGSSSDSWSAVLSPDSINSNSFGLFIHSTGNGICTFGQFSILVTIYYQTGTGITTINRKSGINISPNPAVNTLNITLPSGFSLTVTNLLGIIMNSSLINNYLTLNTKIDVTNYPNGIYFLHAQSGSDVRVAKFVVQH
jgi:hypothetical protein